ncbi:hybrid sensor histidine kinase/response regulator transcription factor [Gelidibacter salicanalis]|uniref:histidine kinase n=1 Tax=Gelidibacter salicanalis TaxID=291193 RepID=A0A934KZ69_9FLAO|nr:ATP-binding protein [Gelidibacter salicanalis]MBJ7882130.1 response regulator [Gelidibacter salicanalis]
MHQLRDRWTIFYFFLGVMHLSLAQNHINFTHISPSSDNTPIAVTKTIQDNIGNIWMVQKGDIYVFDGYNYSLIPSKRIFPKADGAAIIKDMITDTSQNIYLSTYQGFLTRYNAEKGTFEDLTPLLENQRVSVMTSRDGSLWIMTNTGTIYAYKDGTMDLITTIPDLYHRSTKITDFAVGASNTLFISTGDGNILFYSLASQTLEYIDAPFNNYPEDLILTTDTYDRLWIGTETKGLFLYDIPSKTFIQESFFKGNYHNIKSELFLNLFIDSNDFLWAGTDGGGLYKVNLTTGDVLLFMKQTRNEFSLSSNTILHITEDNHQNIWITPNYGNLNILPNAANTINYHEGSDQQYPNRILSLLKSSDNILWAGTDGSGLTKITFNGNDIIKEETFFNDPITNKGFYIQTIAEDNKGNIWVGTYKNGLWIYDAKARQFKNSPVFNVKNQKASDVRTVYTDRKGRIWVGSNTCLNIYNDDFVLLASFENNTNNLKGLIVQSIIESQDAKLWLGTVGGGLFQFNENYNKLNASTFIDRSIRNSELDRIRGIKHIAEGAYNSLWLIDDSGKLLKYDTNSSVFSSFEELSAISNKSLTAVINIGDDNLWISSTDGIINFKTHDSIIKTYYSTDGLQDNTFLSRSAFKDHTGMLYFGGLKGFNYFYPQDLFKKESRPILQINNIEVLNQPANVLLPDQITEGFSKLKTLKLKHNESSFAFRFAAIDNVLHPKYYYAYRLKGFDKDWILSHHDRSATYTNIPAGNYTFEVKAGTKDDTWDVPTKSITINIEKPFWNKPIAWVLYLCVGLLIIYGIRRWYGLKKNLYLEKINHKNENELHQLKMNFFAKMSHEIQTPLTLILGPIEDMIIKAEKNGNLLLKQRLNIIAYNARRLSKIAYELTLVRNKELDKLRLMVTKNNLHDNVEDIVRSFNELARKKNIDFTVNSPKNLTDTWYDKDKIEHIIYNLLSNAFKFTPREGNIQLIVTPVNLNKMVKIAVSDSGAGVAKEELDSIFELFYQSHIGKKNKGTGIGLALTKELIDLHKGTIEVESSKTSGTTFSITFPVTDDVYTDTERITVDYEDEATYDTMEEELLSIDHNDPNILKKTVLIVEDTLDLQLFLKELLEHHYNIILAENGNEGYYYAKSNLPDLILSDIMMPELDGIEMSKLLQEDQLTKHIPVILMTAKNSTNSKLKGLKSGAIEYINKPFNTNELLLKIQNILISKEYIISKYRKEVISRPEDFIEKSQDELFLENLVSHINLRLEDSNFKMEDLVAPLNMSYSSIYRKCQSLTGHSLVDFVRILRLKKAAILITKHGYTVSETAFKTGFNDPKYFSKCFKKHFKKNPIAFKNDALATGVDEYLNKHEVKS